MIISQTVKSIYIKCSALGKRIIGFITNFPHWLKSQRNAIKDYTSQLNLKIKNLYKTNLDLGLYHLRRGNLNDAIMRLKIVDMFIKKNDSLANYWLGWAYFLKGNYEKSDAHFAMSSESQAINLSAFIKKSDSIDTVPEDIWNQYRDLTSLKTINDRGCYVANLPQNFIATLLDAMEELPKECNILDLGCAGGFIGAEIDNRLQKNYHLTGVDSNKDFLKNAKHLREDKRQIYDELTESPIDAFLKKSKGKYDVVISYGSLVFTTNLTHYFRAISNHLKANGYFALLLPVATKTQWDSSLCQFIYSNDEVKNQLNLASFSLIYIKEYSLNKHLSYIIIISKKVNDV